MKKIFIAFLLALNTVVFGQQKNEPTDFIPEGYVLFDTVYGDLNKDGVDDCVLIIKGTDKEKFFMDKYRGELDRNRRGLVILFKKKGNYELVLKNEDCFSSENEDGGVYYAPELEVSIKKGNLYISYLHGRYGGWLYNFRYKENDFDLIGFEQSSRSLYESEWVTFDERSINFLTHKMLISKVVGVSKKGNEKHKKTWKDIKPMPIIKLSKVEDFDELYFDYMD